MIRFITTERHGYTFATLRDGPDVPPHEVANYRQLMSRKAFPPGTYIFTDIDRLSPEELLFACRLAQYMGSEPGAYTVLNHPARVRTRYPLLRALHASGRNPFNVYRVQESDRPARYPVFLRIEHGHAPPLSGLLDDAAALEAAIAGARAEGFPESELLIVEYAAEPCAEGLFRRHAAYRVGERLFHANTVHEGHWYVKEGTQGIAGAALYEEERRLIEDNPHRAFLREVFELAAIDYGRVDFGIVDGRPVVYEINTNPRIGPSRAEHPSPIRQGSIERVWRNYVDALRAIDTAGAPVTVGGGAGLPGTRWY